jgi:tetratricopeptide (TPR) repeat protein
MDVRFCLMKCIRCAVLCLFLFFFSVLPSLTCSANPGIAYYAQSKLSFDVGNYEESLSNAQLALFEFYCERDDDVFNEDIFSAREMIACNLFKLKQYDGALNIFYLLYQTAISNNVMAVERMLRNIAYIYEKQEKWHDAFVLYAISWIFEGDINQGKNLENINNIIKSCNNIIDNVALPAIIFKIASPYFNDINDISYLKIFICIAIRLKNFNELNSALMLCEYICNCYSSIAGVGHQYDLIKQRIIFCNEDPVQKKQCFDEEIENIKALELL